jgi:superoxide dismutase, Cu-Zn family
MARISFIVAIAFAWPSAALGSPVASAQQQQPPGATADIRDASGRALGSAEFREDQGKVQVTLVLPTPSTLTGKHGLHIMDTGRCDAPDFASAGGIFNPLGKKHGILASGGAMVGDLPNLAMPLQRYNAPALGASLATGPTSLLGPRGTALVIYANEDDGLTDPEGNAGARVACGVIVAGGTNAGGLSAVVTPPLTTAAQSAPGTAQVRLPAAAPASAPSASAPSGASTAGLTLGPAIIIVVLGAALIGAGLLLRRPRRP